MQPHKGDGTYSSNFSKKFVAPTSPLQRGTAQKRRGQGGCELHITQPPLFILLVDAIGFLHRSVSPNEKWRSEAGKGAGQGCLPVTFFIEW